MLHQLKSLSKHEEFIRYFKNTSWMMAEQFLRILSGLFVGIWVARYLGPEQFGLFSYVLAFTAIFSGIAKLGLDGIMVRELVNHPEKRDYYLGTAFWLKVMGALIVMGLMATIVPFTSNDTTTNTFIFIIASGLIFQSFEVIEFYFQSQVLAKIVSICKVIQLALSSIIKIYLVLIKADLIWFVAVTAFDALSLAVSYVVAYQINNISRFYKNFDLIIVKKLLHDSWPLIISAITVMVYMRIDQIMIRELLNIKAVGYYSVAVRLTEVWLFITVSITTSVFPSIVNAKKVSEGLYLNRVINLYRLLFIISIVISLFLSGFSRHIVGITFGDSYNLSSKILAVYAWSNIFVFLNNASWKWYLVENLQRIAMIRLAIGATSNILLNLIFINDHGAIGAAYATLISYLVAVYFGNLIDKRSWVNFWMLTRAVISFNRIDLKK